MDTRDELGFGDEMVLVKMLMEIALSRREDDDGDDFPLPEGSFPGRTAPSEP